MGRCKGVCVGPAMVYLPILLLLLLLLLLGLQQRSTARRSRRDSGTGRSAEAGGGAPVDGEYLSVDGGTGLGSLVVVRPAHVGRVGGRGGGGGRGGQVGGGRHARGETSHGWYVGRSVAAVVVVSTLIVRLLTHDDDDDDDDGCVLEVLRREVGVKWWLVLGSVGWDDEEICRWGDLPIW
jgi:hypothetical protein